MKLIIGLGNPGQQYCQTRHNVGFMFLDYYIQKHGLQEWKYESKFFADISMNTFGCEKIIFMKPQTFMNLSGKSVQALCQYYKIPHTEILIVYDDISMNFGKIRFRQQGSPGGHNGIKDIVKYIGQEFDRIKIAVGYDSQYEVSSWVLGKFSEEELIDLENEIFPAVEQCLHDNFLNRV